MDGPELHGDEKILIRTQGVHVKSISFEAILTNKRIILVDRIKNILPPKEILLATVNAIETGENAIGDLTVTLGVITKTGGTRQMVLTFPREGGGRVTKERDEWARQIRSHLTPSFEQVIRKVMPGIESRPVDQNRITPPADETGRVLYSVKKSAGKPQETDLPPITPQPSPLDEEILGTYCTKCGTKVPEGSGFCNKCGTRIVVPGETGPAPVPPVAPSVEPEEIPVPPVYSATDLPEEPVPDPVPVTRPVPPVVSRPPAPSLPATPPPPVAPVKNAVPAAPAAKKRFVPKLFSPKAIPPAPLAEKHQPSASQPRRQKKPFNKKKALLAVGIVFVILIAVVAVFVVLPKMGITGTSSGGNASTSVTSASAVTTTKSASSTSGSTIVIATTTPVTISGTGVSIKIDYVGGFTGTYTANGETTTIKNSGTKVYEVTNATGTLSVSVKKNDNTASHALTAEIYKDGSLIKSGNTSAAYGEVTVSANI